MYEEISKRSQNSIINPYKSTSQIGRRESKFLYKSTCLHINGWGLENMREPDNDILLNTLGSAPLVLLYQIPIVYSLEHSSTKLYALPNRVQRY